MAREGTFSYMKMSAGFSRKTQHSSRRYSDPRFAPIEHLRCQESDLVKIKLSDLISDLVKISDLD